MTPSSAYLGMATAVLLVASTLANAEPVPTPPVTPKPSGPVQVPYPDTPPPEPCPLVCLPKPKPVATLQLAGGESTIEVESFSWGSASAADGPTTVNTSDPQEGGEIAPIGRKAGGTPPLDSPIPRAEVNSPRDSASGLATGRRQHKPIRMSRGSVEVTMPEGVCVAGAHYPAVTIRSGDKAYAMRDVTVASCTPYATAKGKKDKAKLDYMVVTMETILVTG